MLLVRDGKLTLDDPICRYLKVAPAVLATYAGRYQATPSNILTIAVDGPGLSIQSSEGFSFGLKASVHQTSALGQRKQTLTGAIRFSPLRTFARMSCRE